MNQYKDMPKHRNGSGEIDDHSAMAKSKRQLNGSHLVLVAWLAFVMLAILLAVVQVVM